ncbi:Chromosome transmission fidelity protein 8 [Moelleriella libera RCEF 2490]|uniref:Chromosome transmission fidelity protein 8 n=1 Tax=Moelleriella libera RCEF 2490 TaxID=1081109 RepID=A0A167YIG4_9HYPO|nr:Chromosome transmission fidelity protein 8 [Moelleriella libera RCEF 2490]
MSSANLYPPQKTEPAAQQSNALPQLLQTPSGLALLELQGTINLPVDDAGQVVQDAVNVGKIDFPDYVPDAPGSAWMKRVHVHIGQHQRLTGEVKKLPKAIAVIRRRESKLVQNSSGSYREEGENLEIVEIVKYKIVFSTRPEPVGTENAA